MEEVLKNIEQLLKENEILLLMAYGSQINGNATESSDLDIFIISENRKFIAVKKTSGIKVEMHCFPIDEIKTGMMFIDASGDTYLKSVLKTGKILKNKYNTYEQLTNILNFQVKKKRVINRIVFEKLEDCMTSFICDEEKYKNNYYFFSLELIRRLFHVKENLSTIPSSKVYELYQNTTLATEKYCLKLPSHEFRDSYLKSLTETNREKQKLLLIHYVEEFKKCESKCIPENQFLSNTEIKQKLITLHNKVEKCQTFILKNHPYADAFYNIIVYEMLVFRKCLEVEEEQIENLYEIAIITFDNNQRILILDKLFRTLEERYSIDYDDFYLPLQRTS